MIAAADHSASAVIMDARNKCGHDNLVSYSTAACASSGRDTKP
jgi:hypothetical protein